MTQNIRCALPQMDFWIQSVGRFEYKLISVWCLGDVPLAFQARYFLVILKS